jgi:hypothetical protein
MKSNAACTPGMKRRRVAGVEGNRVRPSAVGAVAVTSGAGKIALHHFANRNSRCRMTAHATRGRGLLPDHAVPVAHERGVPVELA